MIVLAFQFCALMYFKVRCIYPKIFLSNKCHVTDKPQILLFLSFLLFCMQQKFVGILSYSKGYKNE